MTANRKSLRAALRSFLASNVSSAQAVYAYGKSKFDGQSPVICITSAASERERITMQGSSLAATLDIHTFVIHRSPDDSWTEENAEDALDDIEQQIAQAIDLQPTRAGAWGLLKYAGPSDAREVLKIEGVDYLHEVITVEAQEYR